MWWVALLVGAARADDVAQWELLHDALLERSLRGVDDDVEALFEQLAQDLPAASPVRGRALLALGEARVELGDVEGARAALRECVRMGPGREPCLQLLGRVELDQGAVREIPLTWTFSEPEHGFVHPWSYAGKGSVRVEERGGDPALTWTTRVEAQSDDQLVLGFHVADEPPSGVKFTVHATAFDAHLRLVVYDVAGNRFTRGQFIAPIGRDQPIDAPVDTFQGVDDDRGALDPATIHHLVVQDVTGYVARSRGDNTLVIDDFTVY